MITEYKIARATEEDKLETEVNELIRTGWEPHGSMVFVPADKTDERGQYDWFMQPMVKVTQRI